MRITDGRPQSHKPGLAVRYANDSLNNTPSARHQFKATGLQVFQPIVDANPIHWQPFLSCLRSRESPPNGIVSEQVEESTPGIYLGRSPVHARSGTGSETKRVSPQFHSSDGSILQHSERTRWQRPPPAWRHSVVLKGKRVLPAEETHSAEPEFVSLSDKGQEIEDKDNDQSQKLRSYNDGSQRATNG
jgi:hypothetical protein